MKFSIISLSFWVCNSGPARDTLSQLKGLQRAVGQPGRVSQARQGPSVSQSQHAPRLAGPEVVEARNEQSPGWRQACCCAQSLANVE